MRGNSTLAAFFLTMWSALPSACAERAGEAQFAAEDFLPVALPGQPPLTMAIHRQKSMLVLAIETIVISDNDAVMAEVGVAAARAQICRSETAKKERYDRRLRFVWTMPASALIEQSDDWRKLRVAMAIRWPGGPNGMDRRRERYRHADGGAPSAGLSPCPQDWLPFDLEDYESQIAERRQRLIIPLEQPFDGKYSVVIEDLAGKRIRNLAAGMPAAKGVLQVEWDGFDEDGRLVNIGSYRWRAVHHLGVAPEFVMNFCNADEPGFQALLSNHCHFISAAANREWVVLAAVGTEGGFAMAAFDRQGRWRQGYNPILGSGWNAVAVALDDRYLYAAHDGEGWGMKIDKGKPNWRAEVALTLTRFELQSGRVCDYSGGKRWSEIERHAWGPGAEAEALRHQMSLSGMAFHAGRLYIGSRATGAILVVDAESGQKVDSIRLPEPGPLAAGGGRLVAVSGKRVVWVDVGTHITHPFADVQGMDIRALALADDGRLFVADGCTHTVKIIGVNGKREEIGKPGGAYTGAWMIERMISPSGLAVLGEWLWVAEDRVLPKRAVAWDLTTKTVARQVFGNPAYGSPGAGFDPQSPYLWVGEGARWKLDFERKTAECLGILGGDVNHPMHFRYLRQQGHTYLLAMGMVNVLALLENGGALRPVAKWASCHHFSYGYDWYPPEAFVKAFASAYPEQQYQPGQHGRPNHGPGVLWVDRNGDGQMQAEEFEFSGKARLAGAYWGHDQNDLVIRLPAVVAGKPAIVAITPDGIDDRGIPRYPHLSAAIGAAIPLKDPPRFDWRGIGCASSVDRAGNIVLLSDPMTCWAPDGGLRWRYPNAWADVHGSHAAPLPEIGVIQGAMFILGMAPLDEKTDVFVINGNHGRFFVMTSDGIYLDEMFNDCRVAQTRDAMLIGGECFGGVFGRSADGRYWLQTGGGGYRIYRVHGLDSLQRSEGKIDVTVERIQAAQRRSEHRQVESGYAKSGKLSRLTKPPSLDGSGKDWPSEAIAAWSKQGERYRVAVYAGYDNDNLYLRYDVADDPSPWINNGADWTLLFKTGDSVDLQLGTDADADPQRKGPVPGDLRLLMAPMGRECAVVLYRHRVPGTKQGVAFSSPWRSEVVDEVRRLEKVRVHVWRDGDRYRVEAVIPLAEVGFKPVADKSYKADFGVIYGDHDGTVNLLRNYWSNQATGLVNDVPGEIMLQPHLWGEICVE